MTENTLAEAFPREQRRCRKLVDLYTEIGPPGAFGRTAILAVLARADKAAAEQDTVAMVRSYREMQGCK